MSGGKTAKSAALGGIGVICLEVALQLSGFQSLAVAIILVLIACVLFIPLLNEKSKVAWSAGRRLYATYGASRQRLSMIIVILIGAVIGGGGLGLVWWALQSAHVNRPTLDAPNSATTEKAPSSVTHQITSSPLEIMRALNSAGALQKEDVAAAYINGAIEWQLYFFYVKPVRGDAAHIEVVFGVTTDHPDIPLIICVIPRKGNEYLGVIKGAPGFAVMFRVKAVITDIDYEHHQIKLGNASLEQLPSIETVTPSPSPTAPAKDVSSRLKIRDTPDGPILQVEDATPTPSPKASPPREEGPKNVPPKESVEAVHATTKQQEISALHKGRTAIKVMDLIKPYEGQIIEVNGTVYQVDVGGGQDYYAMLQNPEGNPVFVCHFKNDWAEKLRSLDQGAVLKVRGKIAPGQNGLSLVLIECDLL